MNQIELPVTENATDFCALAQHMKIRVIENGKTKVQLTQAASNIDRLDDLLDDDVKTRITEQGIDLREIVADVRARAYAPGPVFELTADAKTIQVSLE